MANLNLIFFIIDEKRTINKLLLKDKIKVSKRKRQGHPMPISIPNPNRFQQKETIKTILFLTTMAAFYLLFYICTKNIIVTFFVCFCFCFFVFVY